jgi:hypothetical protein
MKLSECPILDSSPLCLRAAGAGIEEIDMLTAKQRDAIDLFVSQNRIATISNIVQFQSLRRLHISYNSIARIEDLLPLAQVQTLRDVNLEGNPVCRLPFFFMHVLYLLPNLEVLNNRKVETLLNGANTREQVRFFIESESELLRWLAMADLILEVVSTVPRPEVPSLPALFRERFPPAAFAEYCAPIRRNYRQHGVPAKYLGYLADLVIEKQRQVGVKLGGDESNPGVVARHSQLVQEAAGASDPQAQLRLLRDLSDAGARFVEGRKGATPRSRLSERFSTNGSLSVVTRQTTGTNSPARSAHFRPNFGVSPIASVGSTPGRRVRKSRKGSRCSSRSNQSIGDLPADAIVVETVPIENVQVDGPDGAEGGQNVGEEEEAVGEGQLIGKNADETLESPEQVSAVIAPSFALLSRVFGTWKRKSPSFTQARSPAESEISILVPERSICDDNQSVVALRCLSERVALRRRVEAKQELVALARERIEQFTREVETRRGLMGLSREGE